METVQLLEVLPDGSVPGLYVIGFHGEVLHRETPARVGPVYADSQNRLARIIDVVPNGGTSNRLRIESHHEPLPENGELPGYGTRIGPWRARLHRVIVCVGTEEQTQAHRLNSVESVDEPPEVEQFIQWLKGGERRSDDLTCEWVNDEFAAWYCTRAAGYALWQRIHRVVEKEFYLAIRKGNKYDIENASWWLSRAAVTDQDIFLAATGLRRAGVADWDILLREGLRLKDKEQWTEGLERAGELIAHPPRFERVNPMGVITTMYRDQARVRSLVKAFELQAQAA